MLLCLPLAVAGLSPTPSLFLQSCSCLAKNKTEGATKQQEHAVPGGTAEHGSYSCKLRTAGAIGLVLPDTNTLIGHRVLLSIDRDIERVIKCIDVYQRTIDAQMIRSMRVGQKELQG